MSGHPELLPLEESDSIHPKWLSDDRERRFYLRLYAEHGVLLKLHRARETATNDQIDKLIQGRVIELEDMYSETDLLKLRQLVQFNGLLSRAKTRLQEVVDEDRRWHVMKDHRITECRCPSVSSRLAGACSTRVGRNWKTYEDAVSYLKENGLETPDGDFLLEVLSDDDRGNQANV